MTKWDTYGISGGDIPKAAEERGNKVATDPKYANSQGIHPESAFEFETRGALDSGILNTGRPKWKELEKHIYVHLSEDHFDPELDARQHKPLSRSPPTQDQLAKVQTFSIPNVQVHKWGLIFVTEGTCETCFGSWVCRQLGDRELGLLVNLKDVWINMWNCVCGSR